MKELTGEEFGVYVKRILPGGLASSDGKYWIQLMFSYHDFSGFSSIIHFMTKLLFDPTPYSLHVKVNVWVHVWMLPAPGDQVAACNVVTATIVWMSEWMGESIKLTRKVHFI